MAGLRARFTWAVMLAVALVFSPSRAPANAEPAPSARALRVALLGDPQLGYGPGGLFGDAERFKAVVAHVNDSNIDLVVIPGDLVQQESLWQRWMVQHILSQIEPPTLLAAGNHDVTNAQSLAAFREHFGPDYYDQLVGDVAFVVVNSETARAEEPIPEEYREQWAWIESTLTRHRKAGRQHIFLVTHRPPFRDLEDEATGGHNWPVPTRRRILELCRSHGVHWILAGHIHETIRTTTRDGAITTDIVAGSSRVFDASPVGYNLLLVSAGSVQSAFITVAKAHDRPVEIPGLGEWTPRILDFSWGHWFFTCLFLGTALLVRRARGRGHTGGANDDSSHVWRVIFWLLLFFAVNYQLDFDELGREAGRIIAKVSGVHAARHVISGLGLLAVASFFLVWTLQNYRARDRSKATTIALLSLLVPGSWFLLSTISHHEIGMVLDESWWDILTLAALATIGACAVRKQA